MGQPSAISPFPLSCALCWSILRSKLGASCLLLYVPRHGEMCAFFSGDYHPLQIWYQVSSAHTAEFESATSQLPIRSGGVWLYNSPSALSIRQWNSKFQRATFSGRNSDFARAMPLPRQGTRQRSVSACLRESSFS